METAEIIDVTTLDGGSEPVETTQEGAPGTENVQSSQDNQQTETQTQADPVVLRGKEIRDAVRALSQQSPQHAKVLKQLADAHFREAEGWKGAFETPQKAAEAKSIIESAGGIEGIAKSQERIRGYEAQDAGLESGDPAVLDAFFKDFPQGAAALAPHYLSKLEQSNPQAFQDAIGPYAINMLIQAGLQGHIDAMVAETDPARAKSMAQQLGDWLKGQIANASQLRQRGTQRTDPQADKLKQRETELNEKEEKIFRSSVSDKVNASVEPSISAIVDQYAKQYKLNDTQKAHYRQSLQQEVIREMNADESYKKQAEIRNADKARTPDGVAKFIAAEFSRRAKDKAFDVAKNIYGSPRSAPAQTNGTGVVKAGTPQTAPGGGPIKISARPADSQLDLSRPGADLLLIKGQGYLKDGRFVTWR